MRVPLAVNLESQQGSGDPVDPNYTNRPRNVARVVNGIIEVKGERALVRKRPGLSSLGQIRAGVGQLLWNWNGIRAVVDDYIHSGTIATIISGPTATNLSPTNADLQMSAANTGSGAATPRMMFKNRSQAWTMNRAGTVSSVTYGGTMGAETYAIASLSRAGTVATAVMATDVPYNVGDSVTIAGCTGGTAAAYNITAAVTGVADAVNRPLREIPITITRSGTTATATTVDGLAHDLTTATAYTISGANQSAYNGSKTITVTGASTFTYTVTVTSAVDTTWNPSDKDTSGVTLSGSDLVASFSSNYYSDQGCGVRATEGRASGPSGGKYYFEVVIDSLSVPTSSARFGPYIGVVPSSTSLDLTNVGLSTSGAYYDSATRVTSLDGGNSYSVLVSAAVAGDVIGVAYDGVEKKVYFYKNNVLLTSSGMDIDDGVHFPVAYSTISTVVGETATSQVTGKFKTADFTYSPPSGYSEWKQDSPVTVASGSIIVTDPAVNTPASFTYAIASGNDTAAGAPTVQGTGGTVPGIVYLNGYFFVMDTAGRIWNSASEDPTTWGALDYVDAQNDYSRATGLSASRGYVVAFKEWSTEFFYDAGNASGSPLSPVDSGTIQIGCATGWSIASIDDSTFWMSQTKAKGRGVHVLTGLETRKVSTPDVDRILDDDALANVYAFCLKIEGHTLYVLTLAPTIAAGDISGITLVYDATSDTWVEWNASILGSGESAATISDFVITRSRDTATLDMNSGSTTVNDGQSIIVAGANQTQYNGLQQVLSATSDTFQFNVHGEPTTPATGTITYSYIVPRRLPFVGAISFGDTILLLHESRGLLYTLDDAVFTDGGYGIEFVIRTPRFDGGTLDRKSCASVALIGNKVSDHAAIRWSDDDFATATKFRPVDLSEDEPQLRRCGAFKRRSFEVVHTGNTNPIFEALEIDLGQ